MSANSRPSVLDTVHCRTYRVARWASLLDPAPAEHQLAVVADDGLAWGNSVLRIVESDAQPVAFEKPTVPAAGLAL